MHEMETGMPWHLGIDYIFALIFFPYFPIILKWKKRNHRTIYPEIWLC